MTEEHVTSHEVMRGKVHVYRRENSRFWQCATFLNGRNWRTSTKREDLNEAKHFAEDWYIELKGKSQAGLLKAGRTFREAAEKFIEEYPVITEGNRSEYWIKQVILKLNSIIIPYFGDMVVTEITSQSIQDYRLHRAKTCKTGKAPARSTIHQEIVAIRQVLKTAMRQGWLQHLPDLSVPYRTAGKIAHRAWFSPQEYKSLYEATRTRAANPLNERWRHACEQMHDYVLFMVNTGLRPDEAARLEFRDVAIVTDEATGERILEIEVRGKRGVGYCKSMPGAVVPYKRLQKRIGGEPLQKLFGKVQRELFNNILAELDLKLDRDGQRRTAYSLRHTYICLRLMEGADIYQIAKNCRTSVEMIEKYYASHIKNTLDAAAINKRKPKKARRSTAKNRDEETV